MVGSRGRPRRAADSASVVVTARLTPLEAADLERLATLHGVDRSAALRLAIKLALGADPAPAPVDPNGVAALAARVARATAAVRAGTFRLENDDQAIVSRDELILATRRDGAAAVEDQLYPAVFDFFRAHVDAWGWFYPRAAETLDTVLASLRAAAHPADTRLTATSRIGADYLRAAFRAYWDTDTGPVRAFADDAALRGVLRYRLGLNNSKDYTYTLANGEVVTTRETFDINVKNVRRGFVVQRRVPSFFKPGVASAIYRRWIKTDTPVVWDPSGGFGGRLLGYAAAFPRGAYYAHEPATQTHRDLINLAETLVNAGQLANATVFRQGSEFAGFVPDSLDYVFTSPPYFDLERYFDEPGQCWRDHPTLDAWVTGYVRPTMRAAFAGLRPGCHASWNVDNARRDVFIAAAQAVGFHLVDETPLELGADHFARGRGAAAPRTEPILTFRKPAAP